MVTVPSLLCIREEPYIYIRRTPKTHTQEMSQQVLLIKLGEDTKLVLYTQLTERAEKRHITASPFITYSMPAMLQASDTQCNNKSKKPRFRKVMELRHNFTAIRRQTQGLHLFHCKQYWCWGLAFPRNGKTTIYSCSRHQKLHTYTDAKHQSD